MSSSEALWVLDNLLGYASELCPELVPPKDTVITDSLFCELLQGVAKAAEVPLMEDGAVGQLHIDFSNTLLDFLCGKEVSLDEVIEAIKDQIDAGSREGLLGLSLYQEMVDLDNIDIGSFYILPLAYCFYLPNLLDAVFTSGELPLDIPWGEHDNSGVLGAALNQVLPESYLFDNLVPKSIHFEKDYLKILPKYPLLAHLAPLLYFDETNYFLGALGKFLDDTFEWLGWFDIPSVNRDYKVYTEVQRSMPDIELITSEWLFGQVVRTLK